jgi:hypothetical protein
MMVKNTWRKRLTAFINTASRYNHASPVIVRDSCACEKVIYEPPVDGLAREKASYRCSGTRVRSCVCSLLDGLDTES